jgi:alkanesulfonate monooxygenase SsuD/methylene tetrahydromethanopterin reductase-like flavin-dependent oxidoreductase (luciferase family)
MKFGVTFPPFGGYADIDHLINVAVNAENAGWDGLFLWDHVFFDPSFHANVDPWVALAAIAARTTCIRLGTLITPLARRRPWIVARQTATLDQLSMGRLTLGVGLGDPVQWDFGFFHEATDNKIRASRLDEALSVLAGLWSGEFFEFQGQHYHLERMKFLPTPAQVIGASKRVPIWVGGYYPRKAPMRRAARWDGYYPIKDGGMQPADWREAIGYIRQHRTSDTSFDVVHGGAVPDDRWHAADTIIAPYRDAGVTWWIEGVDPWFRFGHSWEVQWEASWTREMDEFIARGAPKVSFQLFG